MFKWLFRIDKKRAAPGSSPPQMRPSDSVNIGICRKTLHLALQHHQAGHLVEAETAYREVLAADPENFDALHLSGVVAHQLGQHEAAAEHISRALARNPSNAPAHNNLGAVLRAQGKLDEALSCFQKAVALQSDYADARTNLIEAYVSRGNMLRGEGQLEAAGEHFRAALTLKPDSAATNVNFGNVLHERGKLSEAITYYERAIALDPGIPEAHQNLGNACKEQERVDEAVACYRRTLVLRPDWADTHYFLGNALKEQDDLHGMLACYRRALALKPDYVEARWAHAMCQIPAVYESESDPGRARAEFSRELDELERWFDATRLTDGFKAVGVMQPFLLAYQEQDNRALLQRYGDLCARIMSAWFERQNLSPTPQCPLSTRIKVGVVSQHFFNHSVWNAIVKGWFQRLDRERFSLHAFYLGTREDEETRFARTHAAGFEMGRRDLRQWVEAILGQALDVLIYPEIGMDPMTARLASLRLAPVQVASWGHPETTGLPTIDYYLSAEDLESTDAQANNTERLIMLPHLGCFYEPLQIVPVDPGLPDFGHETSTPIFLCPGVPFKYASHYDRILTGIARRLGRCRFIFFTHRLSKLSEKLRNRFERAFSREGLDAGRFITFVPWQNSPQFHGCLRRADVFLDTLGFSGFNTAIQAIQCGIPVVTKEGRFMRGRLASGILKRMGMGELVAKTEEDYIALAVKLAQDGAYRQDVRGRIEASRRLLFEDDASIRALEKFLADAKSGRLENRAVPTDGR